MAADEPGGALRHKSVGQLYFSEYARDSPPMVGVGTPIGGHGSLLVHAELVAGAASVEAGIDYTVVDVEPVGPEAPTGSPNREALGWQHGPHRTAC